MATRRRVYLDNVLVDSVQMADEPSQLPFPGQRIVMTREGLSTTVIVSEVTADAIHLTSGLDRLDFATRVEAGRWA